MIFSAKSFLAKLVLIFILSMLGLVACDSGQSVSPSTQSIAQQESTADQNAPGVKNPQAVASGNSSAQQVKPKINPCASRVEQPASAVMMDAVSKPDETCLLIVDHKV